jgi:hypothetical protein
MKEFTLKRIAENDDGTFGVLIDQVTPFALTVENMWLNNVRNLSCIPTGQYTCRRVDSPKFGDTFEVMDVKGRTHILFHKGNTEDDTAGCILVAEEFGYLNRKVAVLSSSRGYGEFMQRLEGQDSFTLKVEDHRGRV